MFGILNSRSRSISDSPIVSVPNAMTVDVEDWHNATILQVSGYVTPPTDAVRKNTERLCALFEDYGVRATWFFLGEVAQAFPQLVQMVVKAGHEVGVHGYHHHQIQALSLKDYRASVIRAKETVEEAGGFKVVGYRAVDFGINQKSWSALDMLAEAGFKYDSSIFPFAGPRYGMPNAPVGPHWITTNNGSYIYEIPVSVATIFGAGIPGTGGGYLRHFPLLFTQVLMRRIHAEGRAAVFYMHPCEIQFPDPLVSVPVELKHEHVKELRMLHKSETWNRQHTERKLRHLLREYKFGTIQSVFGVDGLEPPVREQIIR